jgi:putative endonuclease
VTDASAKRFKAYRRGHRGEWLAALALMAKGFWIVERRYRRNSARST